MALIELKQYEDVIFPNLNVLQKSVEDIHKAFRHLKELHKIPGGNDDKQLLDKLNRKFNDLVNIRANESLKMSMDLEDIIEYFRMLINDDEITVDDLLDTLLRLKNVTKER